jgi:hypothetical protein
MSILTEICFTVNVSQKNISAFYFSTCYSSICRNTGDACPVRRDFGDLAFPQGEELIHHIDVLRRILLSSPEGNRTVSIPSRMTPFPS